MRGPSASMDWPSASIGWSPSDEATWRWPMSSTASTRPQPSGRAGTSFHRPYLQVDGRGRDRGNGDLDEAGEPVRAAQVRLFEDEDTSGIRTTQHRQTVMTGCDRGMARFPAFARGPISCVATAHPRYAQRVRQMQTAPGGEGQDQDTSTLPPRVWMLPPNWFSSPQGHRPGRGDPNPDSAAATGWRRI